MDRKASSPIICYGEILWDALPRGIFLGGAPLNVAAHLVALDRPSVLVSAVGNDFLGQEALERLDRFDVGTDFVERLTDYGTGVVKAKIAETGDAEYDIIDDKAWDHIQTSAEIEAAIAKAPAMVHGSLAARAPVSRDTLERLLEIEGPLHFFDVNLRPPHWTHEIVEQLLTRADVLKMNRDELIALSRGDGDSDIGDLIRRFSDRWRKDKVCITDGGDGAWFFDGDQIHHASTKPVTVRDTVGAGDAFSARLLDGLLRGEPVAETLAEATQRGSLVASLDGAVPIEEMREHDQSYQPRETEKRKSPRNSNQTRPD